MRYSLFKHRANGNFSTVQKAYDIHATRIFRMKFVGASSIRGDGFNSAIFSGDTIAKLAIGEMKEEGI